MAVRQAQATAGSTLNDEQPASHPPKHPHAHSQSHPHSPLPHKHAHSASHSPSRSWLVALVALVLLAAAGVSIAVQSERQPARSTQAVTSTGGPVPVTPVLSARRVPEVVAAPVADNRLTAALQTWASDVPPSSCVTVDTGGRELFSVNATAPVSPASVEKLLTAEAALAILTPDATLQTTVVAGGKPHDGVVDGNVWMVGGGDPLLTTDPYVQHFKHQPQIHSSLEVLADRIVAAGVRTIHGSIVGDESRYDTVRYLPQWPSRFATLDEIGPLSALIVNGGLVAYPPSPDVSTPKATPADDPAQAAADELGQLLVARGVTIDGPPASGPAPGSPATIATLDSQPVGQIVTSMLRESDNLVAELLTKEMGLRTSHAGTTAAGVAAIDAQLRSEGLPTDGRNPVDGSGLAIDDRETCALIEAVLAKNGPDSIIGHALPVAGQSGTLNTRFVNTPLAGRLEAKTGTLEQVSALAGFLTSTKGAAVTFVEILNVAAPDKIHDDDVAVEEQLPQIIDTYPDEPDVSQLVPVGPG